MKILQLLSGAIFLIALTIVSANASPKIITWDDLAPENSSAPNIDFGKFGKLKGTPDISEFDGSQDDLELYVDSMEFMRELQPQDGESLANDLNGKQIKIAGYITPLTFDGDEVIDFLFVPYVGACVHVPPPPANQIVYVENAKGMNASALYDPIWLTGKLETTPVSTLIANVGYTITGATIEPYTK